MSKLSKNMKAALAKFDQTKQYELAEACGILKEVTYTKFDSSVELVANLGVDPRKANQMIRGVVSLPHGTGKVTRVLVLCTPDKEAEAKEAGAGLCRSRRVYRENQSRLDRCRRYYLYSFSNG